MSHRLSARSRPFSVATVITAALLLGGALTLALLLILGGQTQQSAGAAALGCGDYAGVREKPFQQLDFDKLDYGIYWFGRDNHCRKALPGEPNPYFDPARPTVLYVHGWEADTTRRHFRETFYLEPDYPGVPAYFNTANAWIDHGWNIGIFYWNQFSDETAPGLAEGKIWSAAGPSAMRWRTSGGSFMPSPAQAQSAGELFYQAYVSALGDTPTRSPNIRLVGHSLGSQLAVYGAELISARRPDLQPNRIALLDPHFSLGPQPYLSEGDKPDTAAARINSYVDALKLKGVVFEQYQTTALGDITGSVPGFGGNDANQDLQKKTALVRLYPDYVPWLNPLEWFHGQHVAAISWYFWSYSYPSIPQCATGVSGIDKPAPSARSTDNEIRAFMASGFKFEQLEGKGSADPGKSCLATIARRQE